MAGLLERQINASYVTTKVFSNADLDKFQTLFNNGATTHQQDILFKAISEGKDPDLINAYVNSFQDRTITTDTTATLVPPATLPAGSTLKTELFKRAIATGSVINNNGNLQNLFLYAFNKTAGDQGSIYAQKILNVAETPNATFANNPQYIATLEKISTNLTVLAKGSGFEDAIDALSINQANRRVITRPATDADLAKFDTFSARNNDIAISRERFFRYLLTDVPTPLEAQWVDSFDKMFRENYVTTSRSDLFDDAFYNSATNSSVKYSNIFFGMINTSSTRGLNYAQVLNGSQADNSGMTRSNNPSKETYIDNLQLAFNYNNLSDKMAGVLNRHITSGYATSKILSNTDFDKFKILFDKNATTQQQDLLFKAISEGKDPDLINAYVNSFIDGTITSDTDITTPPPTGYTPKTVLFERAIASSLTNNNGDLQNLFLFAYNLTGGKSSIQAEQLLNIIDTPTAVFSANPRYVSSLENISKNLTVVAKGSGFEDIMNALAANQRNRINISRSLSNADIDKFDKFNDRTTDNPTDREKFIKYLLTDRIPEGQNLTTAWVDSFDKMFRDAYSDNNRRILFDRAYEQTSINSSAKYSNIFIEMFNRSVNGYDYANSLVNTMVNSTNPSKDKYIDNLKRAAELAMPASMISFLERHLNTGDILSRTFTDTEFNEYRILLNATATVPPNADNDDIDKLFKMHTLNPANDSGVDNDLEAAFAEMFQDGSINIRSTPTGPSRKEALLDRFLPDSIVSPPPSKIILGNKVINIESYTADEKEYTAEEQQLDFLRYFNKDEYIAFSKELIVDNFMVSYQTQTASEKASTLSALNRASLGDTPTAAEVTARRETLIRIQALDLDPKPKSIDMLNTFKTIFREELLEANNTLTPAEQDTMTDNFIIKIANTALNGLPLDANGNQKVIFAETMAAILRMDNSTLVNVTNDTANNIIRDYVPSLNNMLALNASEVLVDALRRFAEAGRPFEAWMTAEDIEIFSEIADSPYFRSNEIFYTDLYIEMVTSLRSTTPEERERKDNYRNAFKDILLDTYSDAVTVGTGPTATATSVNLDGKFDILSSLIKGIPAADTLYNSPVLETSNPRSFPPTGMKLFENDEENVLDYLSTLETDTYAVSALGLINLQRGPSADTRTRTSDPELRNAIANVNTNFPVLSDTEKKELVDNFMVSYQSLAGGELSATLNTLTTNDSTITPEQRTARGAALARIRALDLDPKPESIDMLNNFKTIFREELVRAHNALLPPITLTTAEQNTMTDNFIIKIAKTEYIANINTIDRYIGINGFDVNAESSNLNPQVVSLTANLLDLSKKLIDFSGDNFNPAAQKLELLASYVLNDNDRSILNESSISPHESVAARTSRLIGNWLTAPENQNIYTSNILTRNLTGLLQPIIRDLKATNNSNLATELSEVITSLASRNVSNNQNTGRNLVAGTSEDRIAKRLTALDSIYQSGNSISTPITITDLNFVDKFEDIYVKFSINNSELYNTIVRNFADTSKRDFIKDVLGKIIEEDNPQIGNLSYSARRQGATFILNSLNTILKDPLKSIIPGFNDENRLANLEKSFNATSDLKKLYPDAYNDTVNFLLTKQADILTARVPVVNALPNGTILEQEIKAAALAELTAARNSVQQIRDFSGNSLIQYFTEEARGIPDFSNKLSAFNTFVTNEAIKSDVDLLKAYADRIISGSPLKTNLETLIKYEGENGFKLSAVVGNLDDASITTASQLIDLAKEIKSAPASTQNSMLIEYLEDTTNLILNSNGQNRNSLKDFTISTTLPRIQNILSGTPKRVNVSPTDLKSLLEPYHLINEGINNYDPELIQAYARGSTTTPPLSSTRLDKLQSLIKYQGSNGFRLNADANISTLLPADLGTRIDEVYDLISKADELNEIAEFSNSGLVTYLERNAQLFLINSPSIIPEKTDIKNFSDQFMDKINLTLMNPALSPTMINDLLASFSLDSEPLINGSNRNYTPDTIRTALANRKRNGSGQPLDTLGAVITNRSTQRADLDVNNNSFFRDRGFRTIVRTGNTETPQINRPKIEAQILLYQVLKSNIGSLLDLENSKDPGDRDNDKINRLQNSSYDYDDMITALQSL
jgi:hypothetical protein